MLLSYFAGFSIAQLLHSTIYLEMNIIGSSRWTSFVLLVVPQYNFSMINVIINHVN